MKHFSVLHSPNFSKFQRPDFLRKLLTFVKRKNNDLTENVSNEGKHHHLLSSVFKSSLLITCSKAVNVPIPSVLTSELKNPFQFICSWDPSILKLLSKRDFFVVISYNSGYLYTNTHWWNFLFSYHRTNWMLNGLKSAHLSSQYLIQFPISGL